MKIRPFADVFKLARSGTPWALARYGDADGRALNHLGPLPDTQTHCRETVSARLRDKLREGLARTMENYWVGLPCASCRPSERRACEKFLPDDHQCVTLTSITMHRSRDSFIATLTECLWDRNVVFCAGGEHDVTKLPFSAVHLKIPDTNCFDAYDRLRLAPEQLGKNAVVLFAAGRLGNVLVGEWFEARPDCTFVNVGILFDDATRHYYHPYYANQDWKVCVECNPLT